MVAAQKKKERPKPGVTIHTRILAPKALRKEVLSLAIVMIELMKKYRTYVVTKQRKELLMRQLRKKVKEIKDLRSTLNLEELPLSLGQVEALPQFRGQKKAIEKIEEARLKAQRAWEEEHERLRKELSRPIKVEKPKAVKEPKARQVQQLKKPADKLQSDLEALRRKMASI